MKRITLIAVLAILSLHILPMNSQILTSKPNQEIGEHFNEQILCMAKNIYYEAASESHEGKLAVAQVTMNRTKNPKFPKSVCDVVYQQINGIYQFSWVGMNVSEVKNKYAWEESLYIARKALTEHVLHDKIYNTKAMYYHNNTVEPGWKLKYVTRIGNHLFYTKT